jgi:hypothetical protein
VRVVGLCGWCPLCHWFAVRMFRLCGLRGAVWPAGWGVVPAVLGPRLCQRPAASGQRPAGWRAGGLAGWRAGGPAGRRASGPAGRRASGPVGGGARLHRRAGGAMELGCAGGPAGLRGGPAGCGEGLRAARLDCGAPGGASCGLAAAGGADEHGSARHDAAAPGPAIGSEEVIWPGGISSVRSSTCAGGTGCPGGSDRGVGRDEVPESGRPCGDGGVGEAAGSGRAGVTYGQSSGGSSKIFLERE